MHASVRIYQCDHVQLATLAPRVDVLIADPPFSPRVHQGQRVKRADRSHGHGVTAHGLGYDAWTAADVDTFVGTWSPRVTRWIVILCSHDMLPLYESALAAAGRYVFAPVPCIIRGMSVRLAGDGPSSWTVYALAARPIGMRPLSGTLPGAYVGPRERLSMPGAKPLWLMHAIISDYTRTCDVVCDPCAGSGTTPLAARAMNRTCVGAEPDPARYALMRGRLDRAIEAAHTVECSQLETTHVPHAARARTRRTEAPTGRASARTRARGGDDRGPG
jgi:site-specific DNA-methyltransferase (adenine-specific)